MQFGTRKTRVQNELWKCALVLAGKGRRRRGSANRDGVNRNSGAFSPPPPQYQSSREFYANDSQRRDSRTRRNLRKESNGVSYQEELFSGLVIPEWAVFAPAYQILPRLLISLSIAMIFEIIIDVAVQDIAHNISLP